MLILLPVLASCATNYDVDGITDLDDLVRGDDDGAETPAEAEEDTQTTETFVFENEAAGSVLLLPPDLADTASESLRFKTPEGGQTTDSPPDNP